MFARESALIHDVAVKISMYSTDEIGNYKLKKGLDIGLGYKNRSIFYQCSLGNNRLIFNKMNYGVTLVEFRISDGELSFSRHDRAFIMKNSAEAFLNKRNVHRYELIHKTNDLILIQVINSWKTKASKYMAILF